MNAIVSTSTSSLIVLAVLGLIVFFSKNYLLSWIRKSVEHIYDKELAKYSTDLRDVIEQKLILFNTSQSSYLAMQKNASKVRIQNIQKLWAAVVKLKSNLPYLLRVTDVLTEEELLDSKCEIYQKYGLDISTDTFDKLDTSNIEEVRPFVGEVLWYYFSAYRKILLRAVFLTSERANNLDKNLWFNDQPSLNLMKIIFTQSEFQEFSEKEFGKLELFEKILENKILLEINKKLDEKISSMESLENAKEIQEKINAVEIKGK